MRRRVPGILIAVAIASLLGWYIRTTRVVAEELRREAAITSQMFARIYAGLVDSMPGAETSALLDLSRHVQELGVPIVVTDSNGRVLNHANLPDGVASDSARMRRFIAELDLENPPVGEHSVGGVVHFGSTPIERDTRWLPLLQVALLVIVVLAGVYAMRTRSRADREQVWAGMAREAAHQLGTPISSLSGWIEVLRDRQADPMSTSALGHMEGDLVRLERVAHRFERIGRPSREETVDVADIAQRITEYFRARVPTLARTVTIGLERPDEPVPVAGDAVLLEWAMEALLKNAIDALAAQGGSIMVTVKGAPEGGACIRIADDGPGIPRELRRRVFDAGFTTKAKGWGIGLSLARRIVRQSHRGHLVLIPTPRGATFEIILS